MKPKPFSGQYHLTLPIIGDRLLIDLIKLPSVGPAVNIPGGAGRRAQPIASDRIKKEPDAPPEMSENDDRLLDEWLAGRSVEPGRAALRGSLFDTVTGLPTDRLFLDESERLLSLYGELGVLYINIVDIFGVERICGRDNFDVVMRLVARRLEQLRQELLGRYADAGLFVSGNAFVLILAPGRGRPNIEPLEMREAMRQAERELRKHLKQELSEMVYHNLSFYLGYSFIRPTRSVRYERLFNGSLDDALKHAHYLEEKDETKRFNELIEIIHEGRIETVFQPIIDIESEAVLGYEAFARGPAGELELPSNLFQTAYEADLVWQLDHVCRKRTLERAEGLPADHLLFMNMESGAVHDPDFDRMMSGDIPVALNRQNIVLEVTERSAIADYDLFRQNLEKFRAMGFKVAIDDVGVGFGSLHSIAEVKPDYIKIDMSLIRDCDTDDFRQGLIGTLADFAQRTDVRLIAEGIETRSELDTLKNLGVRYGQGFFFAYPSPGFQVFES